MADEKRSNIYLNLHKSFVQEDIPYTDEETGESKTFNSVSIPSGTMIDGKDVGGYQFSPLFVHQSTQNENMRGIPLLPEKEVWLHKDVLDENNKPILDADGKEVRDVVKVMPQALVDAVKAERAAWRAEHSPQRQEQETVWVSVHETFVREVQGKNDHTFYSIGLAPGTVVNGQDVGNYRFNSNVAMPSKFNAHLVAIPLNGEVTLNGGENFKDQIKVAPDALKEAMAEQRAAWRAANAPEKEGNGLSSLIDNADRAVADQQPKEQQERAQQQVAI